MGEYKEKINQKSLQLGEKSCIWWTARKKLQSFKETGRKIKS